MKVFQNHTNSFFNNFFGWHLLQYTKITNRNSQQATARKDCTDNLEKIIRNSSQL